MQIVNVDIKNFRALKNVSVPIEKFSVLIGENDVGKTSFLIALETFFGVKKLSSSKDWYKDETDVDISIVITFKSFGDCDLIQPFLRDDGSVVINKLFKFNQNATWQAELSDNTVLTVPSNVQSKWFSSDNFHFIPVRRDLNIQFSMNKAAMLGKLLRARMKIAIEEQGSRTQLEEVIAVLRESLTEPRLDIEAFLREQLNNESFKVGFDELTIDPTEGVKFSISLSDDRASNINIEDRGAGTQSNLIIALFRLIAKTNVLGTFIFAMEEPENSLHPKAQRQLLSVIQEISENTQVIVTTHSPVFIDRSKYESNVLLSRTIQGNTVSRSFRADELSSVRDDLGIRASDALLKGGGNCALLVEGNTEEESFPTFLEMQGLSEFRLGIALINIGGSDNTKTSLIVDLLNSYDIPCVIVLDNDAQGTKSELEHRMAAGGLANIREIFVLSKGTIEDYFPPSIALEVFNSEFQPDPPLTDSDFDPNWSGDARISGYSALLWNRAKMGSKERIKQVLGAKGARLMQKNGDSLDPEIIAIIDKVNDVVEKSG
ncbi:ATP-dependent nuclease [Arenicella xantha]|uniref:Putative ATP-dependent endonuclease of OLD family n=1 Tax=Arenicella xantha TaxID=644221 RepID=A0A395JRN7_9GAMM|nr:AAA family ATPase [Arenicella xantha]RBP52992.1 putative ATP-dependent endonuclease of OLD family [Arenicella xantha]